jgi:hypothetical protein
MKKILKIDIIHAKPAVVPITGFDMPRSGFEVPIIVGYGHASLYYDRGFGSGI